MADKITDAPAAERSDSFIEEELAPEVGLLGAIAIGVGTMIAAGIFVLSGLAVSNVGAMAIVSFILAALVAGFTATAYAEFASVYQESGGGYMYVANTFESDLAYIMGWTMILGYPASAAFYLASFSDWFYRFMYPVFSIPEALPYWVPGLVVLGLLVAINIKGTEESNRFQIVVTLLKVGLILLFLYGGFQGFDAEVVTTSFAENVDQLAQIGLTSALVFITFVGFSAITTNAEEIKQPAQTIPRAIYISMGFVTVIYALVVFVIVLAVNNEQFLGFLAGQVDLGGLSPAAFVGQNGEVSMGYAAQYYLGDVGFYVIIVGALFSMLSAANATILAGSRVKLAMARRNHLPSQFEDLHPRLNTPHKTVLLTGGFILAFIAVFTILFGETPGAVEASPLFGLHLGIESVTQFANVLLICGYTIVNVAIIFSRRKHPDLERGFKVPLVPYVPILAVVAHVGLLINVEPTALLLGLAAEGVGVAFWFAWKARAPSVEEIEAVTPTAVAEYTVAASEHDYQIVVPLANPDHVAPLMRTAIQIARDRGGSLLLVSVVTVPEQTPLSRGHELVESRRPVLRQARQQAEEADIPVNSVIRIGHHAGEAILNTLVQHNSQAVLMGWKGERNPRRDVVLGTTVDKVVANASGDVFIEKVGVAKTASPASILVPTGGGPHAELAADTARAIAKSTGAQVRLVRIARPGLPDEDREQGEAVLEEAAARLEGVAVETALVEGDHVAEAIVREAEGHDIVVIGATLEGLIQRFLFGTLPETVSERLPQTVVMVKRQVPVTSRLRQSVRRLWRF